MGNTSIKLKHDDIPMDEEYLVPKLKRKSKSLSFDGILPNFRYN